MKVNKLRNVFLNKMNGVFFFQLIGLLIHGWILHTARMKQDSASLPIVFVDVSTQKPCSCK